MESQELNMSDKMKEKRYCTSDLALAAYLRVKGFHLSGIRRISNGRASFEFENSRDLLDQVIQFINGQCLVPPLTYWETVKSLKAMINN